MAYPIQNHAVLEIGKINFVGDIIPHEWYQHIKYENGKACHHAIAILANIVYWYRPTTIKAEATGRLIAHQQKFKAESLQRSYQSFADQFGLTRRQAQSACDLLESLGLIKRYTKAMSSGQGTIQKALYIDLCVDRVKEITFSSYDSTYVEPSSYIFDVHSNVRSTTLERTYTEITNSNLSESLNSSRLEGATTDKKGIKKEKRSDDGLVPSDNLTELIAEISDLFVPDKSMRTYLRGQKPEILKLAIATYRKVSSKKEISNPGGYFRSVVEGLINEGSPQPKSQPSKPAEPVPYPKYAFQPGDTITSKTGSPWLCLNISEHELVPHSVCVVGLYPESDGKAGIYEPHQFTFSKRAPRVSELFPITENTVEAIELFGGPDLPRMGANLNMRGYSFICDGLFEDETGNIFVWDEKYDRCYPLSQVQ
jgi:hypothetical protein